MQLINYLVIGIILIVLCIFLFFVFKKNYNIHETIPDNVFTFDYLIKGIKFSFQNILNFKVEELNLNKDETEKRLQNKAKLRESLRNCYCGDTGAKEFVKDYIRDLLQQKYGINEETIDNVIPFQEFRRLKTQDKFEIMLYLYKKQFGLYAFEKFIVNNSLDQAKLDEQGNPYFKIAKNDIEHIYNNPKLNFIDKINIVSQRIYQMYLGHGAIDEIRDMYIDGISGGVSGLPIQSYSYSEAFDTDISTMKFSYDSVWCFFQGKFVYLECLGFKSQEELERICRNIYRYNSPGQLSEEKGYITNDMKDGSRVVVVRPPFSDSWAFLVRKHNVVNISSIKELITDPGNEFIIKLMECLIKGQQIVIISGEQGCGKTTLLRALIEFISPSYSLRIQELIFELSLRKLYPERNILTFKELPNIPGQEGLDLQKKTDGSVNILGEVASSPVANWLIQMSQSASLFTMCTHHAKRTEDLVSWMRNALLKDGGFNNEMIAEEQVVSVINFDVHMRKSEITGHRYIERVTEIVPVTRVGLDKSYHTEDIITYCDGEYRMNRQISNHAKQEIFKHIADTEKEKFAFLFQETGGANG